MEGRGMAISQCHPLLNISLPAALVWLLDGGGHQPYSFGMALSSYCFCGEKHQCFLTE